MTKEYIEKMFAPKVHEVKTFYKFKEVHSVEDDGILKVIFAPDPITGKPRSDLALVFNKSVDPEISQYIKTHLMQARKRDALASDPDTAMELTKDSFESVSSYYARLRSIADASLQKPKTSESKIKFD